MALFCGVLKFKASHDTLIGCQDLRWRLWSVVESFVSEYGDSRSSLRNNVGSVK